VGRFVAQAYHACLDSLAVLHAAFTSDVAAAVWDVSAAEAEHRLEAPRATLPESRWPAEVCARDPLS